MPTLVPEPELLAPVAPFDAYREDVTRLAGRSPIGAADDAWLVAAHALARAAMLDVAERPALLVSGGDAVRAVVEAARSRFQLEDAGAQRALDTADAAGEALQAFGAALHGDPGVDLGAAVEAMQQCVGEQEMAGALRLALTTLGALRDAAAPVLDARADGLLLAQQGRAARQLGALDAARRFYRAAIRAARRGAAPDAEARAWCGFGVLAGMRGNYPEARVSFRRARAVARRARLASLERDADQGMLFAAAAARDVATMLEYGWALFRKTSVDAPMERVHALGNLADAAFLTGAYRAALGACLEAMELATTPALRLPALSTAARAAVMLGEARLVSYLLQDMERVLERTGQPWENARALVELAEALRNVGDARAASYAARAEAIARAGGFHETRLRAEVVADSISAGHEAALRARGASTSADRLSTQHSPRIRAVLRSMETLPAVRRYSPEVTWSGTSSGFR